MIEDCLGDIHNIVSWYERAKGYCRAKFNTLDVSCIVLVKTMKKSGKCYKCRGPLFQHNCTDNIKNNNKKFKTKTPIQQVSNGNNYADNFATAEATMCLQHVPFHSRHTKQLGQVMICW